MEKKRVTLAQKWLLAFTIIYVIAFMIYFLINGNYEFVLYNVVVIILIFIVSMLHLRVGFPTWILVGLSIWGLLHNGGASIYIGDTKLYSYILIPLYSSNVAELVLLKYDQFAHFYFYVIATLLAYYVIEPNLAKKFSWPVIATLLVFIGMGIGALNEIIEFIPALFFTKHGVGGYYNTMLDIVFNTIGAIVAVLIIHFRIKKTMCHSTLKGGV